MRQNIEYLMFSDIDLFRFLNASLTFNVNGIFSLVDVISNITWAMEFFLTSFVFTNDPIK